MLEGERGKNNYNIKIIALQHLGVTHDQSLHPAYQILYYRQAVSQLQVTADDIVIRDIKITSNRRVVSATMIGNAIQVNSHNLAVGSS